MVTFPDSKPPCSLSGINLLLGQRHVCEEPALTLERLGIELASFGILSPLL